VVLTGGQAGWCVFLETGDAAVTYPVEGLTTERALVLGEVYRRDGRWRLRAVGQGWEGGLAGLATDYGVSITTDEPEPVDNSLDHETDDEDVYVEPPFGVALPNGRVEPAIDDLIEGSGEPADGQLPAAEHPAPRKAQDQEDPADSSPPPAPAGDAPSAPKAARVRIAAAKSAGVPVLRLAEDPAWQPSRLFSISGIGGVDEQEKRATSALLWAMSAVRPLGRALTARATAPAGAVETFLEVRVSRWANIG
jgi:hypothetical protein